jgi:hypothetical protein
MKKAFAVVVLAGVLGCGSVASVGSGGTGPMLCSGSPTAYVAESLPAMGDTMKLHVGLGISGVWPQGNDFLGNTYMLDGTAQLDLLLNLSAELSAGWASYDYDDGGYSGELTVTPIFLSAFYTKGAGPARWYIGGGMQWEINDASEVLGLTADSAVGGHATTGLSFGQNDLSFQLEARYTFSHIDVDYSNPLDPDITIDGGALNVRVKILYNF